MKRALFICLALAALAFVSCEKEKKEKEPPRVDVLCTNIAPDNMITFQAHANTSDGVIMFMWWIYCDGEQIGRSTGNGFAANGRDWKFTFYDEIKVQGESQKKYKAVLRYYDEEYNDYYATSEIVAIP